MRRNFNSKNLSVGSLLGAGTGQFKLRIAIVALLLSNAAALYLYLNPPGGSQQDLAAQDSQIRSQIAAEKQRDGRLRLMASRVQNGSSQVADFEKQYFLPKRAAYGIVIAELQRMAKASGLDAKDAGFSEEPIEGTSDLSLLNIKANYEGSYASLLRFLYETDRSPMLLMLDSVQAAPEQKSGQIRADIRYQVIIQDASPTVVTQ